jgi:hypothetical protein
LTRRRRRISSSLLEDERKRAGAPSSIDREGGIKWSNSEGEFREKTKEKDTKTNMNTHVTQMDKCVIVFTISE